MEHENEPSLQLDNNNEKKDEELQKNFGRRKPRSTLKYSHGFDLVTIKFLEAIRFDEDNIRYIVDSGNFLYSYATMFLSYLPSTFRLKYPVDEVKISKDESKILAKDKSGHIYVLDSISLELLYKRKNKNLAWCEWLKDSSTIIICDKCGNIEIYMLDIQASTFIYPDPDFETSHRFTCFAYLSHDDTIALGNKDGTVSFRNRFNAELIDVYDLQSNWGVEQLFISKDESKLLVRKEFCSVISIIYIDKQKYREFEVFPEIGCVTHIFEVESYIVTLTHMLQGGGLVKYYMNFFNSTDFAPAGKIELEAPTVFAEPIDNTRMIVFLKNRYIYIIDITKKKILQSFHIGKFPHFIKYLKKLQKLFVVRRSDMYEFYDIT